MKYHEKIKDFSDELTELGHYEFGNQRRMFNLNNELNTSNNIRFKTTKLYLNKFIELLDYILKNYSSEIHKKKIIIFNYDNLKKFDDLAKLLQFLNVENDLDLENYFNNNFLIKGQKRKINELKKKINFDLFNEISKHSII